MIDAESDLWPTDCGEGSIQNIQRTERHDSKLYSIQEIWEWGRALKNRFLVVWSHILSKGRAETTKALTCSRSLLRSWDVKRAKTQPKDGLQRWPRPVRKITRGTKGKGKGSQQCSAKKENWERRTHCWRKLCKVRTGPRGNGNAWISSASLVSKKNKPRCGGMGIPAREQHLTDCRAQKGSTHGWKEPRHWVRQTQAKPFLFSLSEPLFYGF